MPDRKRGWAKKTRGLHCLRLTETSCSVPNRHVEDLRTAYGFESLRQYAVLGGRVSEAAS